MSRGEITCVDEPGEPPCDGPAFGDETYTNSECEVYDSNRPHLLIPLHLTNNSSVQLPPDTTQLRARATIEYSAFDGNQDRSSEERVFLQVYRWSDLDGDGTYITNSWETPYHVMPVDEWTEADELDEVTSVSYTHLKLPTILLV